MGEAIEASRFVFGNEIRTYLESIYHSMADVGIYEKETNARRGDELTKAIENRRAAFNRVEAFYKDAPKLFEPYMKLDQKMRRLWR
jgi:hypothetical protein